MAYLQGIKVIDLGRSVSGPYACQILADLGAEVVKVVPPGRGMPDDGSDGPGAWRALDDGKTVVALNLEDETGTAALAGLLRRADVLIESFRPGRLDSLGFGVDRLRELNRGLVHVALTGWGLTGPYRDRTGEDINYMAFGGALAHAGTGPLPGFPYPPTAEFAAGRQAALAAVAALFDRSRRGPAAYGATIDVAVADAVLAWQAVPLAEALAGRPPERRRERLNGGAACYQIYRTADGRFLSVGALDRDAWAAFCAAVARPDWVPRHADPLPQKDLIAEVGDLLRSAPLADWQVRLAGVDCCVEPLWTLDELPDHPHVVARGLVRTGGPPARAEVALPMIVDGAPPPPRAPIRFAAAEAVLAAWGGTEPGEAAGEPGDAERGGGETRTGGGRRRRREQDTGNG